VSWGVFVCVRRCLVRLSVYTCIYDCPCMFACRACYLVQVMFFYVFFFIINHNYKNFTNLFMFY
jgi:hypothetical protein